jgi:hypothetical protein
MSSLAYVGYFAAALLVVGVMGAFSLSKLLRRSPEHDSRYLGDRNVPLRRFAQGAAAAYRGNVGDPGYWARPDALSEMTESWSTPDARELSELLEGYRAGEINLAFDKVRIVWLARVAFACGWFDEATSWGYVNEACHALRSRYRGWDEVARDVEAGAIEWNRRFSTPLDDDGLAWRRARAEEARRYVWPYTPFEAPL